MKGVVFCSNQAGYGFGRHFSENKINATNNLAFIHN